MIAVIDYGVGNLYSLCSSLRYIGTESVVTSSESEIFDAEGIILPGVGAFGDARAKLSATGLEPVLKERAAFGVPLLGICLGMQLLFEKSYEYGEHDGLGLIPGTVVPIAGELKESVKIPHMGWNSLSLHGDGKIFKYIKNGDYVYYVHSYYAKCEDKYKTATSEYGGITITGAVARGNVFGTQFHPEKSGSVGLDILRGFCEISHENKKRNT